MQTFGKAISLGLVGVALTLAAGVGSATATPTAGRSSATAETTLDKSGNLLIHYKGPIINDTVRYLSQQFERHGRNSHRVILALDSSGGSIDAGERVIHLLNRMKLTHRLTTMVLPGQTCGSMCVPIFLQGQERMAARTSVWLFHEAASSAGNGKVSVNQEETLRLFRRYFIPAGVSVNWLKEVVGSIKQSNVWQTGQDLIEGKSGIITHSIGNQQPRRGVAPKAPAPSTHASGDQRPRFLK